MIDTHIQQIKSQQAGVESQIESATGDRAEALANVASVLAAEVAEWDALGYGSSNPVQQRAYLDKAAQLEQDAAKLEADNAAKTAITDPSDPESLRAAAETLRAKAQEASA